ncbi:MAG: YnfA family protein [Nitriliruptor sp.]|uniref:YnfA family protein n=1 Tax=Nitriliruptor sp. TaxID=2448056 RepID=UPI0034A021CE
MVVRSVLLYLAAGLAELGGAWLVWQGVRERGSIGLALLGGLVLFGYGALIALQPAADFGRIMAAYGGLFIVAALVWGRVVDGFQPDRFDLLGAAICLVGGAVIIYAPRAAGA